MDREQQLLKEYQDTLMEIRLLEEKIWTHKGEISFLQRKAMRQLNEIRNNESSSGV